jgi:hypothetical protein
MAGPNKLNILLGCTRVEVGGIVTGELSTTHSSPTLNKENDLTNTEDTTLPSWVPDWTCRIFRPTGFAFENCVKETEALLSFFDDRKLLTARGKYTDTIKFILISVATISKEFSTRNAAEERTMAMKRWLDLARDTESYPSGKSVQLALTRTLCLKHPATMNVVDRDPDTFYRGFYAILDGIQYPQTNPSDNLKTHAQLYTNRVQQVMNTHTFYITNQGYFGFIPFRTQLGDVIVLLAGASCPFVLRPVDDKFVLIGPAYLDCNMNGEAFPEDKLGLTPFTIR